MSEPWNVYESFQALLQASPFHFAVEGALLLCIIWLLVAKSPRSRSAVKLSKKEEEQLLSEWTPEPLVLNPPDPSHPSLSPRIVDGKIGLRVMIGGKKCLNLASHNYLNLSCHPELEEAARNCLHKYGVGSCGPRGFYGTTEVHLELEERLAKFYGTEMAALYSYGFTTIASVIPSYAKNGDVIFADEMVNYAIQRGMDASRSRLVYFRHNDMEHLEDLLEEQVRQDKKDPKKAAATRRFLVVEGIYMNTGDLCNLPDLIRLRRKYKLRLLLDESCTFGTIGSNARGITDHFNISLTDVDVIMSSLETAAASSGGFCTGTKFVIDHQRLSGLGYCYSASLPPMLAAASIKVIDILEAEGGDLVMQLQEKCQQVHDAFIDISEKIVLVGDSLSPVKHLQLKEHLQDRSEEEAVLRRIVEKAERGGVAIVVATHLYQEKHPPLPPPSIRLTVNKDLSSEDIQMARKVIAGAMEQTFID